MIWIIGDIHGMIGPLKRVLEGIEKSINDKDPLEKIIFIGDYIDHGENSKEVLDKLMNITAPCVFLAGNHEDLALRFLRSKDISALRDSSKWLQKGGYKTYISLLKGSEKEKRFIELYKETETNEAANFSFEEIAPPAKYINFLENLKYSHREIIDCGYGQVGFSFFHGLPRTDRDLDSQRILNFDEYEKYRYGEFSREQEETAISEKPAMDHKTLANQPGSLSAFRRSTFLMGRKYNFYNSYGGEVIVHGHTPTLCLGGEHLTPKPLEPGFEPLFDRYKVETRLPFLFSRGEDAGYKVKQKVKALTSKNLFHCGKNGAVEGINVDTGAVYRGGALTALGLSGPRLAEGELVVLTTLTAASDKPRRRAAGTVEDALKPTIPQSGTLLRRTIKTGRFGWETKKTIKSPRAGT
ncbi:MAG: metallophosphoesterase [Deltaproteobacteria bacterium]|nr:metallophosphoesterase [Deltaproteobacteria bacterium]